MADSVSELEQRIGSFFGAHYVVAVDSATSGLELCLRYTKATTIQVPQHTYLSVPMLAQKLGIKLIWYNEEWKNYYKIAPLIYDAAVLWEPYSYIKGTFMCISCQFQKHFSIGRLGFILCDNKIAYNELKRMRYDGRETNINWREQNIKTFGIHAYITPETASLALSKLDNAIRTEPRKWTWEDYPNLLEMDVFKTNINE